MGNSQNPSYPLKTTQEQEKEKVSQLSIPHKTGLHLVPYTYHFKGSYWGFTLQNRRKLKTHRWKSFNSPLNIPLTHSTRDWMIILKNSIRSRPSEIGQLVALIERSFKPKDLVLLSTLISRNFSNARKFYLRFPESDSNETFEYFKIFLREIRHNFRKLDGSELFIHLESNLPGLSKVIQNHLKGLSSLWIECSTQWSNQKADDSGFEMLVTRIQKKLTELEELTLDFNGGHAMTHQSAHIISLAMKNLTSLKKLSLNFKQCFNMTDEVLTTFGEGIRSSCARLKFLKLNFDPFHTATDEGFAIFRSKISGSLTDLEELCLNFQDLTLITDEGFLSLISAFTRNTQLTKLSLCFDRCEKVTDKGLELLGDEISTYLTQLTYFRLVLQNFDGVTKEGFGNLSTQILRNLSNLKSLDLKFWGKKRPFTVNSKDLETLGLQIGAYQQKLEELQIYFEDKMDIDDAALENFGSLIFQHLSKLKKLGLKFRSCKALTNRGLEAFGTHLGKNLHELKILRLDFCQCDELTDKGAQALHNLIATNLKKMYILDLVFEQCRKMSNQRLTFSH